MLTLAVRYLNDALATFPTAYALRNFVAGDDEIFPFAIDLVGFPAGTAVLQAAMTVKAATADADPGLFQKVVTDASTAAGQILHSGSTTQQAIVHIKCARADTLTCTAERQWDLQVWLSSGQQKTAGGGPIQARAEVTQLATPVDLPPDEVVDEDPADIDLDLPVPVDTLTLTPASATISGLTLTQQMTVVLEGENGEDIDESERTIVYQSSDLAVATVNASGLVTRVGPGTTTITATCEGVSDTSLLTFAPIVESGVVSPDEPEIANGDTEAMTAAWTGDDGNPIISSQVWSSSAPAVISINGASGIATGEADSGTATLTATAPNGVTASTVATAAEGGLDVPPTQFANLIYAWDAGNGVLIGPPLQNGSTAGADSEDMTLVPASGGVPAHYTAGAGDYMTAGDVLDAEMTAGAGFSVVWAGILQTTDTPRNLISKQAGGDGWYLQTQTPLHVESLVFYGGGGGYDGKRSGPISIPADPRQIAIGLTHDPSLARALRNVVYVDGVASSAADYTDGADGTLAGSAGDLRMGHDGSSAQSPTASAYLYIWDAPLSAAEQLAVRDWIAAKGWAS